MLENIFLIKEYGAHSSSIDFDFDENSSKKGLGGNSNRFDSTSSKSMMENFQTKFAYPDSREIFDQPEIMGSIITSQKKNLLKQYQASTFDENFLYSNSKS